MRWTVLIYAQLSPHMLTDDRQTQLPDCKTLLSCGDEPVSALNNTRLHQNYEYEIQKFIYQCLIIEMFSLFMSIYATIHIRCDVRCCYCVC